MKLEELKAHAYDILVKIEAFQRELQATNQAIANYKDDTKK